MAVDYQAEQDAFSKQYDQQQAAKQTQEASQSGEQPQPSLLQRWGSTIGRVTSPMIDSALSEAEQWGIAVKRVGQDAAAGAVTGAVNIQDAANSAGAVLDGWRRRKDSAEQDAGMTSAPSIPDTSADPLWDHARATILDFRDAIAVKDPNLVDSLTQGAAQLAIPFTGYSRALAGLNGFAKIAAAGAMTDATALGPHDMRMADLFALGQHTEGKLGDVLRSIAPDGSAVNAYIHFLSDRSSESEAAGRLKNVLDGFGVNAITTPLIGAVATTLKQGTAGLRYMMGNGVTSASSMIPRAAEPVNTPMAAPKGWDSADGGSDSPVSSLEKDPAATAARTFLKAQTDAGHDGSLHAMVTSLGAHLDGSTPDGAFYKDILGRLSAKKLGTTITSPGDGLQPKLTDVPGNASGSYNRTEDTMALYPRAFQDNKTLVHTVAHEAVHAATLQALHDTPAVTSAITGLLGETKAAVTSDLKPYGLTNEKEFVAEAESNPKFQQLLKSTKSTDGRPLWDHYKEVIGGIFGLGGAAVASPMFDKLLTKEEEKKGA